MLHKLKTWIEAHSLAAVAIAAVLGLLVGSSSGSGDSLELTGAQQDRLQLLPALEAENDALEESNAELAAERSELADRLDEMEAEFSKLEAKLSFIRSKRPMPDLVGASASTIERLAKRFDWTIKVVKQPSSAPAGTIISQTPASGSTVHAGSTIKIVVAKRQPAPEPEPEVDSESRCDPNYSGTCVPQVAYDLNCDDIAGSVTVVGSDPHGFDGDGDGSGCE